MASTRAILSLLAALALAAGVVVIIVTPQLLEAPNALAGPSALVVAIGCAGAGLGGRAGRLTGMAVSLAGLAFSGLWLWLAADGFGLGSAWVDDMVEAGILVAVFALATALLALSEGPLDQGRIAAWAGAAGLAIVLALAIVGSAVPSLGPLPTPAPMPVPQPLGS